MQGTSCDNPQKRQAHHPKWTTRDGSEDVLGEKENIWLSQGQDPHFISYLTLDITYMLNPRKLQV